MKKTLLITNAFLKDQKKRDDLLRRSVISSSAVEGAGDAASRALEGQTGHVVIQSSRSASPAK